MPHGEHDLEAAFTSLFTEGHGGLPPSVAQALSRGFVKAIDFATARATEQATANVTRLDRKRLVRDTAVATSVVVAALCVPVTWILTKEADHASERATRVAQAQERVVGERNCSNISALASLLQHRNESQNRHTETFESESTDRLGLTSGAFHKLIREGREERQAELTAIRVIAHQNCGGG